MTNQLEKKNAEKLKSKGKVNFHSSCLYSTRDPDHFHKLFLYKKQRLFSPLSINLNSFFFEQNQPKEIQWNVC